MKTTLNISVDTDTLALVAASLKSSELGRLFKALAAHACGEDAEQHLNNSGLRLAFALLSPPIGDARHRLETLRANGARGGRPRKNEEPTGTQADAETPTTGSTVDMAKKTKKETLSPTPPNKEKIKKNNNITLSPGACTSEAEKPSTGSALPPPTAVIEWDDLQERMLQEQPWLQQLCMTRRITEADMAMYIMDFIAYLRERDLRESLTHAKVHFVNQLPYIIKQYKTNQNHETHSKNRQEFIAANPVARREYEREARRQEVCRAIAEVAAEGQRPAVVPF
ncbi:MAG: hypothetical protein IJV05_06650 [Muribaculaceae bacterium]|nr:hypothetical protein [Muribaculaceae bacterium]